MSTLYLNESGAVLSVDGGYFCVTSKNGSLHKIPKKLLDSITIFGNSSVTTPCLQECLRRGITVNYFSGKGAYYGKLASTRHVNAERLKSQVHAFEDPAFCLALAQKVVCAKIRNQSVLLRRYQRNLAVNVTEQLNAMKLMEHRVERAGTIQELMGVEGMAARVYFSALSRLVQPDFAFQGRSRQPPKDPFNSMLSLGYTLLLYEIYAELENRGLSPYLGFFHSIHAGHPSLASDLMEEWRAVVVDSAVLSLVQGKEISPDQFKPDPQSGGILLRPDGMRLFIRKMEKKFETSVKYLNNTSCTLRRCFYLQTVDLTKAIEQGNAALYQPVQIR